jgi:3-phosphoshikimate 1-carboxyvinyltransferase
MTRTIKPGRRSGKVKIPASKSQAHRLLICAALGREETVISCDGLSADISATMDCLNGLGADIKVLEDGRLHVQPIKTVPRELCHLNCGESGSTLRFLLPVCGALGANAVFHRKGRLPQRPLAPLDTELTAHGMSLRSDGEELYCSGQLSSGEYSLPGDVSSQYISGLLMALPFIEGDSRLTVTGRLESEAYITMTEDALKLSGVKLDKHDRSYSIPGGQRCSLPHELHVEGDFSNAAFFLCMGALSDKGLLVTGLNPDSHQGDKAVVEILRRFGAEVEPKPDGYFVRGGGLHGQIIDAKPIPDLIPVLSVVASLAQGETKVINAARLRLKESDRLKSTTELLAALGADIQELEDGLIIHGKPSLIGGSVDSWGDHRIAMAAATASCGCTELIELSGSQAVTKSYPRFWDDFDSLTGESI